MKCGPGSLKELNHGKYLEYVGHWNNDQFHGRGTLKVWDSEAKHLLYEEYDGMFAEGIKHGLGRWLKIKDG